MRGFVICFLIGISAILGLTTSCTSMQSREPANENYSPQVTAFSLKRSINQARSNAINEQQADGLWNFPAYLGSFYVSQYLVFKQWLELPDNPDQIVSQAEQLLKSQRSDGSWIAILDQTVNAGDINATVWNYLFVKKYKKLIADKFKNSDALRVQSLSARLDRARDWVIRHGGAETANMLTRILLASMGSIDWSSQIIPIPQVILYDKIFMVDELWNFGQWVGPHLKPIAVLRYHKFVRSAGVSADDILTSAHEVKINPRVPDAESIRWVKDRLMPLQQPSGSWGGYTLATMFNIMALKTVAGMPMTNIRIKKGLKFIEDRYFNNGKANNLGSTQDGRYWDTLLIGQALAESQKNVSKSRDLEKAAVAISKVQAVNGGLPFGLDFEYAPDVDDTAEMITFFNYFGDQYKQQIEDGIDFIKKMQNDDGGWAAFAKNNRGYALGISDLFLASFADSVDFFDESSPDVTGHTLEALGKRGQNIENSEVVRNAVSYIRDNQETHIGAWTGRWGSNYTYGTSAVLVGLNEVGENMQSAYVRRAVNWLKSIQKADGSFGETTASYLNVSYAGKGKSTASQTAWVLLGLIAAGAAKSIEAQKAVAWLQQELSIEKKWSDASTVGTGHPGIVYMDYPSYPYAWPLLALAKYQRALNGSAEIE